MKQETGRKARRVFSVFVTGLALLLAWQGHRWFDDHFERPDFFTGYTLIGAIALLLLLPLRKKLVVLKLGAIPGWLQTHHYTGVFAMGAFFMHTGWPIHGVMETILASMFLFISFSGLFVWYLNRTIPKKLRVAGKAHILEDTPSIRNRLANQAYALAVRAAGKAESASLAEHYASKLVHFFQQPRSLVYIVVPTGRLRRSHLESLERLDRYLGSDGRTARQEMSQLVQDRDDLDFQEALQTRLRLWKGLHVTMLWFFLVLVGIHVVLAHRFHGS